MLFRKGRKRRMHLFPACVGQAHSSAAAGEQCAMHSCVGALQCSVKVLFSVEIWTPFNTWFLGPTRVTTPTGTSIGSAVFAQPTRVPDTDRQTHRPRYRQRLAIGRIYAVRVGDADG